MDKAGKFLNNFFKQEHKKINREINKEEKAKEKRIQAWINKGCTFVSREKMSQWVRCVKLYVTMNREYELHAAMMIMKSLDLGMSYKNINDIVNSQKSSSFTSVKDIVTTFHKYGKIFYETIESRESKQNNEKQM